MKLWSSKLLLLACSLWLTQHAYLYKVYICTYLYILIHVHIKGTKIDLSYSMMGQPCPLTLEAETNSSVRNRNSFGIVGQLGSIDHQILQAVFHASITLQILEVGPYHICIIQFDVINLVWTWKLHPYWVTFTVMEDAMHATGGEKSS